MTPSDLRDELAKALGCVYSIQYTNEELADRILSFLAERGLVNQWRTDIENAPHDGTEIWVTGGTWFDDAGGGFETEGNLDFTTSAAWKRDGWCMGYTGDGYNNEMWARPTHWSLMNKPRPPINEGTKNMSDKDIPIIVLQNLIEEYDAWPEPKPKFESYSICHARAIVAKYQRESPASPVAGDPKKDEAT